MSTRRIKKKKKAALTHLNRRGEAHMVDVGAKAVTAREAVAEGAKIGRASCRERV